MNKKLIIKALKHGVPIRRIAKEVGKNERAIWRYIKKDKEMQFAMNQYKAFVDNLFF